MKTLSAVLSLALGVVCASSARAQAKKPNIVIIWGDDIGQSNVSADDILRNMKEGSGGK